jgi:hypothetical protein
VSIPNVITARELIELYRGVRITTSPQESDVTVGTAALKLGNYANTRIGLVVSNASASTISIRFHNTVTATTGVQLAAGATMFMNWLDDSETISSDLYAISSGSNLAVHVVEYVLSGL